MKPHARHRDAVAAVQASPAQCYVPVRVANVVSMKEQGKIFRQTTMTKMNRCISTEPGMGSKQPVWKILKNVLFIDLACTSSLQFSHILPAKH